MSSWIFPTLYFKTSPKTSVVYRDENNCFALLLVAPVSRLRTDVTITKQLPLLENSCCSVPLEMNS